MSYKKTITATTTTWGITPSSGYKSKVVIPTVYYSNFAQIGDLILSDLDYLYDINGDAVYSLLDNSEDFVFYESRYPLLAAVFEPTTVTGTEIIIDASHYNAAHSMPMVTDTDHTSWDRLYNGKYKDNRMLFAVKGNSLSVTTTGNSIPIEAADFSAFYINIANAGWSGDHADCEIYFKDASGNVVFGIKSVYRSTYQTDISYTSDGVTWVDASPRTYEGVWGTFTLNSEMDEVTYENTDSNSSFGINDFTLSVPNFTNAVTLELASSYAITTYPLSSTAGSVMLQRIENSYTLEAVPTPTGSPFGYKRVADLQEE